MFYYELFNPDSPSSLHARGAFVVLQRRPSLWLLLYDEDESVTVAAARAWPDDLFLSCTTPIATTACGRSTNITIFRMKAISSPWKLVPCIPVLGSLYT